MSRAPTPGGRGQRQTDGGHVPGRRTTGLAVSCGSGTGGAVLSANRWVFTTGIGRAPKAKTDDGGLPCGGGDAFLLLFLVDGVGGDVVVGGADELLGNGVGGVGVGLE